MSAQVILAAFIGLLVGLVLMGYVIAIQANRSKQTQIDRLSERLGEEVATSNELRVERDRYQDQTIELRGAVVERDRRLEVQAREIENLERVVGGRLYKQKLEDVGFGASQAALLIATAEVDLANAKRLLRGETDKKG